MLLNLVECFLRIQSHTRSSPSFHPSLSLPLSLVPPCRWFNGKDVSPPPPIFFFTPGNYLSGNPLKQFAAALFCGRVRWFIWIWYATSQERQGNHPWASLHLPLPWFSQPRRCSPDCGLRRESGILICCILFIQGRLSLMVSTHGLGEAPLLRLLIPWLRYHDFISHYKSGSFPLSFTASPPTPGKIPSFRCAEW